MTDDLSMKAAEYVLGTLAADERAAFARSLASDAAAQALVRDWEARLAPASTVVPAIEPHAALWSRIDSEIDKIATGGNVVDLRRSVVRWRVATALVGSMAASLAVVAVLRAPLADRAPEAPAQQVAQATIAPPAQSAQPTQTASASSTISQTGTVTASASVVRPAQGATQAPTAASGPSVETASAKPQGNGSVSLASGAATPAGGLSVDAAGAAPQQPGKVTAGEPARPEWLAALGPAGAGGLIVRIDQSEGSLSVWRSGPDALDGKSVELWFVSPGQAPRPIGFLTGDSKSFRLRADLPLAGAEIAASVEPAEVAGDAQPSGPFVFRGRLVRD